MKELKNLLKKLSCVGIASTIILAAGIGTPQVYAGNNEAKAETKEEKEIHKETRKKLKEMLKNDQTDVELPEYLTLKVKGEGQSIKIERDKVHAAVTKLPKDAKNGANTHNGKPVETFAALISLGFSVENDGLKIHSGNNEYKIKEEKDKMATLKSDLNLAGNFFSSLLFGSKAYAYETGKGTYDEKFSGEARQEVYVVYDQSGSSVKLLMVQAQWSADSSTYEFKDAENLAKCQWRGGNWQNTYYVGTPYLGSDYTSAWFRNPAECGYADQGDRMNVQGGHAQADFYTGGYSIWQDVRTEIYLTAAS